GRRPVLQEPPPVFGHHLLHLAVDVGSPELGSGDLSRSTSASPVTMPRPGVLGLLAPAKTSPVITIGLRAGEPCDSRGALEIGDQQTAEAAACNCTDPGSRKVSAPSARDEPRPRRRPCPEGSRSGGRSASAPGC